VLHPGWLQHLHIFLHINGRKTEVLGTVYVLYNRVKFRKYHIVFDCDMALCLRTPAYTIRLPLKHKSSSCDVPS